MAKKKKLYGAAAKAHAKKHRPKKKKAKKARKHKRPPWATAKRCTLCGHKRHAMGGCTAFANNKFCPC